MHHIQPVDIVILTVLKEEYDAICNLFPKATDVIGEVNNPNLNAWKIGDVYSSRYKKSYKIAIGMAGRVGTNYSVALTIAALERWEPRYIFFIGIAGGLKEVKKGDVVIADAIYGYEYGKIGKKFSPRSNWTYKTDLGLLNTANAYAIKNKWRKWLKANPPEECESRVISGNIASGDKVVDDPSNDFFSEVLDAGHGITAIEMEGAGVGCALEFLRSKGKVSGFLMMRGISDCPHAQDEGCLESKTERDLWKKYASAVVAAFTRGLIVDGLPVPPINSKKKPDEIKNYAKIINVPELPVSFIPRKKDIEEIKQHLLATNNQTIGITSLRSIGLQGMGGIGKSVLAAAVARDDQIRSTFSDGVFWITIGQQPNILARQSQLIENLGGNPKTLYDSQEGRAQLSELLAEKACLLILDDIWETDHITAFNIPGQKCKIIITTRDRQIIRALEAYEYRLDILNDDDAIALIAKRSDQDIFNLPAEAMEVVHECGNLPLALAMVGSMVRGDPGGWGNILYKLQNADLEKIQQDFPDYPYPNLLKAIEVSVDALNSNKKFYFDLAIFQEDIPIPLKVLEIYWELDCDNRYEVRDIRNIFTDLSLAQLDEDEAIQLHDLQFDYIRKRGGDIKEKHTKLLDRYQNICKDGWVSGPNDGYFYENIAYHLYNSTINGQLRELLLDYGWIEKKIAVAGVSGIASDYQFVKDEKVFDIIRGAILLSAYALINDPDQLKGQLTGRLLGYSSIHQEISELLNQINNWDAIPWLRPLNSCLTPPGGAMRTMLKGHTLSITALAVTPDGKRAISGSRDQNVMVWDVEKNDRPLILNGHGGWIHSVAISNNGNDLVTVADDYIVRIWDLKSSKKSPIRSISERCIYIQKVVISADGKKAAAIGYRDDLFFWDLTRAKTEKLRIHTRTLNLNCIALSPDGKYAITANRKSYSSSGEGNSLLIWDLESRKIEPLYGVNVDFNISNISFNADGSKAYVISDDGSIGTLNFPGFEFEPYQKLNADKKDFLLSSDCGRILATDNNSIQVFDLDLGKIQSMRILKGQSGRVAGAALTANGSFAITGSSNGTLYVWDLDEKGETFQSQNTDFRRIRYMKVNDEKNIAITVSWSDRWTIAFWDIDRCCSVPIKSISLKETLQYSDISAIAFNEKITYALIGYADGMISLIDINECSDSPSIITEWETDKSKIICLSFNSNNTRAISASDDGKIRVWDIKNSIDDPIYTFQGKPGVVQVELDPDGKHAIVCMDDRVIMKINFEEGSAESFSTLTGHTGEVRVVKICQDCKNIVYGSELDGTVFVGDLSKPSDKYPQLLKETTSISNCASVSINYNGKMAVSGYDDGMLIVWDLFNGKPIQKYFFDDSVKICNISQNCKYIYAALDSGNMCILRMV